MLMKFIKIGDEKVKNVVNVEDDNVQSTYVGPKSVFYAPSKNIF